jgi:hypothetical protein
VAVDGSGNVYVADKNNHRIQKFNSSGVYKSTIGVTGVSGPDNSHFFLPFGVAVDGSANVYVADTYNHRIQKFSLLLNDCSATLSNDLSLHVPIAIYDGYPFALDFQWNGAEETLISAPLLTDTSAFSSCAPATISLDLDIHIPVVMYSGVSYWLDLQDDQDLNFIATEAGAN